MVQQLSFTRNANEDAAAGFPDSDHGVSAPP